MRIPCVIWILVVDDRPDKSWSTLLLGFGVSSTDCCISSHGDSFVHTLREDACDNRLLTRFAFFTLYDRSEYEFSIPNLTKCLVFSSERFIELANKYSSDIPSSCARLDAICIRIEESLETRFPFYEIILLFISGEIGRDLCDEISCTKYILLGKIGIDIVDIPTR